MLCLRKSLLFKEIFQRSFRISLVKHYSAEANVFKIIDEIQHHKSKKSGKKKKELFEKNLSTKDTKIKKKLEKKSLSQNILKANSNVLLDNCESYDSLFNDRNNVECDSLERMFDEYNFNNVDTMIINEDENYGGEEYEIYDDNFVSKKNLQSFIHVCLYNDQLSEAHAFLMEFVGKFSNSLSSTDIASCCELLMKGMARKGRTENVIELLDFIRNNLNVKPSINAYESYLLSLCKQMKKLTPVSIENVFERMAEDEHNPNTLLERTNLNASEIKLIRKLFESNNIDFGFRSTQIDQNYGIELVDKILKEPQNYYNPFEGIDLSQMDEMIERQFQIEINSVFHLDPVEAKFRDNSLQQSNSYYQETLRKLEVRWTDLLSKGFSNYLNRLKQKHKRLNGIPFIHYMTIMETEIYVKAMLEEIQKCASFSEHYSPYSASLFEGLGRRIMQEYLTRSNLMDETYSDFKKCYTQFIKYVMNPKLLMQYNPREYWQFLQKNGYHYYFDESKYWPNNVLQEIGKDLYEIISSEARIDSDILQIEELHRFSQPVITFYYKNHDSFKTKKEVRLNPLLIELYEGSGSSIYLESERMPLLSPPVPWITPNFGGNLLIRSFLVRLPQYYPKHRLKQYPLQDLFPTFDSLNALALCPWKINEKVLDVAIDIFKRGGDKNLDIPVSLAHFGPLPRASSDMCAKEKAMIYYKRKLQKKEQAEEYSLWVDCLYKLSIGNSLRGKYFWFPFNADFRSRVYPIPPNFNHLGNDLSRAILLFGKGKPLGENGLDWLKIHLINLTGLKKKSSIQERLKYADEIIDLIIDSADRPLDGQKWWMSSDEKWQTLACCFELTNALRSPDPHSYVSHMPIHQDGSCNGLQHYAALGRDILGAKSVNLSPSEYPQDVYSDVAALVEKEIEKDIAKGVELAKIIKGFINRKIVKQTVMTYVYGVTRYGAKLQVLKRLKEDPNFPDCHKVNAAVYISEKILFSIQQMFTQTRIIQEWLTDCAQIISTEYNSTVEWITPLGFPVIQSYYRNPKKNSNLVLLPNPMKQKNAFPANFIHSLDSSHMMLTALDCHRHGLTFSSVHDCYWTHACDIDMMNYFCRRQFIALHSEQILRNLAKFLHHKLDQWNETLKLPYHNDLVQHVDRDIPQGEFKLETVKDSVYFFS